VSAASHDVAFLSFDSTLALTRRHNIIFVTNSTTAYQTFPTMSASEQKIKDLLAVYETSLNTSDAKLAASCYTGDGVFMPTTIPTASGADLESAYQNVFGAITLNVKFTIDELVVAGDDKYAYALTQSAGTQKINATGDETAEANREIFIFHNTDTNGWKIARYMFNKSS